MITVEDQVKALSALHGMSDAEQRRAAQAERDEASFAERCRAQRHHEVLCLVLKELVRSHSEEWLEGCENQVVLQAQTFADLAYPPPKAECDHEWSGLMASFGHSRRCAKCNHVELTPPKSTTADLRAAGFVPHGRDPLTGAPLPPTAEEP